MPTAEKVAVVEELTDVLKRAKGIYLADFTAEAAEEDYILDAWTWVDLSSLGEVSGLQFTLSSSDNGEYGMNTPAYFAIDDIMRYGQ